jgi:ceramide glucosyltransferase
LTAVTALLEDSTIGVVTCGYLDHHPRYLGAIMASLGRAVDFIPSVLIARALDGGLKFALGPTIATRKSVLKKFGGLQMVLDRIGSDFHIGRLAVSVGYRVELSTYLLENDCGRETLSQVFQRELRWSRTIRWNRGSEYYGLIFTHGPVYSFLAMILSGFEPWTVGVWLALLGVRELQAAWILSTLKVPGLFRWLWLLPLRDWLTFWVWLSGSYGQNIFWRGRWLEVGDKGLLTEKAKQ